MQMNSQCFETFDQPDDPSRCKCKGIVLNTYKNLRDSGVAETEALKVATRVLRHHHPSPTAEARNVVECWVFQNSEQPAN